MDGTQSPNLADDLYARLGTASALIAFNVHRHNGISTADRVIISAVAHDVACERQWLDDSRTGKPIAVHRASGRELSGLRSPRRARPASPEAISLAASPAADRNAAGPPGANTAPPGAAALATRGIG